MKSTVFWISQVLYLCTYVYSIIVNIALIRKLNNFNREKCYLCKLNSRRNTAEYFKYVFSRY